MKNVQQTKIIFNFNLIDPYENSLNLSRVRENKTRVGCSNN